MQRIYTPRLPPPTSQTKTHNYLQLRKEALGQPTLQKKTGSLPSGWDTEQCPARGQQRLAWARGGQRGQGGHGGAGPRHSPSTLTALEARLQVTAPSSRCRPFLPLEEPHLWHQRPNGLQRCAWLLHLPNEIWFHFKNQSCPKRSQNEDQTFALETCLQNTKTVQSGCTQLKRREAKKPQRGYL